MCGKWLCKLPRSIKSSEEDISFGGCRYENSESSSKSQVFVNFRRCMENSKESGEFIQSRGSKDPNEKD